MDFSDSLNAVFAITKEYLLSLNTEETYMSFYTGIPMTTKLFRSPLRKDNKPSCAYWKSSLGILYFKDFATGQCLDFVNIVMAKYGLDYYSALEQIAKDFGYMNGQSATPVALQQVSSVASFEKKKSIIQVQIKDFTPAELEWWKGFGITKQTLKDYNVFSCKAVFLNGKVFLLSNEKCPVFGYYFGKKDGVELWKIYIPLRKTYRWINNAPKEIAQGSQQLPDKGKVLVINKSLKDCMLLHKYKIPAIAPCSETTFIRKDLLDDIQKRFDKIVVMFDNDRAGLSAMVKLRKKYPQFHYIFIPKEHKAKDISDYYKKYGNTKTKELIKSYLKYLYKK